MEKKKITQARRPVDVSKGRRPTAQARHRDRVNPCPFDRVFELAADPNQRFFCVSVTPGEEFAVVARLARHRLPIFAAAPVRVEWRHASEIAKIKEERKVKHEYATAPGYVLVAQPREFRAQRWAQIIACEGVRAPLGVDGSETPRPFSQAEVIAFTHWLSTEAPDVEAYMQTHGEFAEGDDVLVEDPESVFDRMKGLAGEVLGTQTKVWLEFFGSLRPVLIETRKLRGLAH